MRNVSLFDVDDVTSFNPVHTMLVEKVSPSDVDEFCRRWHYTNTGGNMMWNYGLWDGPVLVGVVSYNLPTMPACSAYFGKDKWEWVVHMGRLVCADNAPKNVESRLIGQSLPLLKRDRPVARAVVSYAAAGQGHIGYIYQATNALYCGLTNASNYYIDQKGRRRSPKIGDSLPVSEALNRGWEVHRETGKHRYVYLLGNKTERKESRKLLKFPILPYPKG